MVKVLIKKLDEKVKLPEYKTTGSSGLDLTAFIANKTICISLSSFLRMRSKHYHITVNLIGNTIYGIFIKVIP